MSVSSIVWTFATVDYAVPLKSGGMTWDGSWGASDFGAGYRVGLVTGYDERLVTWAEDVPVLAFGGLVGWFEAGPFGRDVWYVYRAITLETSVRF